MRVKIPSTSLLSKLILALSGLAAILFLICNIPLYWYKTTKWLPADPPERPFPVTFTSHVGLYRGCVQVVAHTPQGHVTVNDFCSSSKGPKWHKNYSYFIFMTWVTAAVEILASVLSVTIKRFANKTKVRLVIAVSSGLTATLLLVTVIMFAKERDNYLGSSYNLHYCFVVACITFPIYGFISGLASYEARLYRDEAKTIDDCEESLGVSDKHQPVVIRYT